jgi:hypothetical protein
LPTIAGSNQAVLLHQAVWKALDRPAEFSVAGLLAEQKLGVGSKVGLAHRINRQG